MKKGLRKAISYLLTVAMVLSLVMVAPGPLKVAKAATDVWSETEIVTNGTFENGEAGWTFHIPKDGTTWKYGYDVKKDNNNATVAVGIWKNKGENKNSFSIAQNVTLPVGTYKVGVRTANKAGAANTILKIGDLVSVSLEDTAGWDTWTECVSEQFEVSEETTVALTIAGTQPAGVDSIYLDDVVIYKYSSVTYTYEQLQALLNTVPENYETLFNAASVEYLQSAISVAEAIAETEEDSDKITAAYVKLQKALGRLVFTGKIYVDPIEGYDKEKSIRGMDVSSYISLMDSFKTLNDALPEGAPDMEKYGFRDWDGNLLDEQEFFDLLAASGVNYIRTRVWNNPYNDSGNGYGGGNNDLEKAIKIGQYATRAGMNNLIDFHFSDFWADPSKQVEPKAWKEMTADQKATAISDYVTNSLTALKEANVKVGMVQIGNETTNKICGVGISTTEGKKLFDAGCDAVHAFNENNNTDILAVLHFTNPERSGNYATIAKNLANYDDGKGVSYDVFASSWYPYWHGTLDNLTSVLDSIAKTYDKYVMVAETSWAYTLADGDGHANTVRKGSNDKNNNYEFSTQGQADEVYSVIDAMNSIDTTLDNGDKASLGVFYWEGAWIPVQYAYDAEGNIDSRIYTQNQASWEANGSGWASSYAAEYDPEDAGQWYGGSAVDNQAFFDFYGNPLASLNIFKFVYDGSTDLGDIVEIQAPGIQNYVVGDTISLPTKVTVTYGAATGGAKGQLAVTWNAEQLAAFVQGDKAIASGDYTITGTVEGTGVTSTSIIVKVVDLTIESIENPATVTIQEGQMLSVPETVAVTYNNNITESLPVTWNGKELLAAVNATKADVYTVTGTVKGTEQTVTWTVVVESNDVVDTTVRNSNGDFETVTSVGGNNNTMANWTFNKLKGSFLMVRYKNKLTPHEGDYALLCGANNGVSGSSSEQKGTAYQTIEGLDAGIYQYSGYLYDSSEQGYSVYLYAYTYSGTDDQSITYENAPYKKNVSLSDSYNKCTLKNIEVKEGETLVVGFYYYCASSPMGLYADDFVLNRVTSPSSYSGSNVTELVVPENATVDIGENEICTINEDVKVTLNGTINLKGSLENNGSIEGTGTLKLADNATLSGDGNIAQTVNVGQIVVNPEQYEVVVANGTADIENCEAGTEVTITAAEAPEGKVFDKWIVVRGTVSLGDVNSTQTTFTMPAEDVELTATYKDAPEDPSEPTPSDPTPTEPTPSDPTPTEPAPSEPAPGEPTPEEPAPSEPAPGEPTPEEPAPEAPTPIGPAITEPAPVTTQVGTQVTENGSNSTFTVTTVASSDGRTVGTVEYTSPANTAVRTVSVPDSVTIGGTQYLVTSVAANAFSGDRTIQQITIGTNVETIGVNAFKGAKKLTTVKMNAKLESVGNGAFQGCTSLKKIVLPATVKNIGKKAFYGDKSLKTITIKSKGLTKKTIGANAFKGISKSATVKVPKSKVSTYKKLLRTKGLSKKAKVKK